MEWGGVEWSVGSGVEWSVGNGVEWNYCSVV